MRSTVMIYELKRGQPAYPQILSDDAMARRSRGRRCPAWSIPWRPDPCWRSGIRFYSQSNIFRIDVSEKPAVITDVLTIQGGTGNYDPEGIAIAPDHTLWIASEGDADDSRPNRLLKVDLDGNVITEIGLPPEILDCRAAIATRAGTLGSGFEGVAVLPGSDGQLSPAGRAATGLGLHHARMRRAGRRCRRPEREWRAEPDPPLDLRSVAETWDHIAWDLAPKPANATWVGLSEITECPEAITS